MSTKCQAYAMGKPGYTKWTQPLHPGAPRPAKGTHKEDRQSWHSEPWTLLIYEQWKRNIRQFAVSELHFPNLKH